MPIDPRLEHYLSSLDRALAAVPVSDRADIVTEIKSHVLSAMEREPQPALDSVLQALGEPEIVANRYLMERGLKTGKPPVSPVVKWIVVGFLGTMALMVIVLGLVLHAVGPVMQVNDKEDRVKFFNGFIDIDGKKGTVKVGDSFIDGGAGTESEKINGSAPAKKGDHISVTFSNGSVETETSKDENFTWSCHGSLKDGHEPALVEKGGKALDLSDVGHLHCSISFPTGVKAQIEGRNGKIFLEQPKFDADVGLDNGKVGVNPAEDTKYSFDLSVRNGKTQTRASDPNPDYHLRVQVGNGKAYVEGKED